MRTTISPPRCAAAREARDRRAEWVALHALGMLWAARDYERAAQLPTRCSRARADYRRSALIAHSLNRVGNWYVNREDPHAGIPYHEEALAIFERVEDQRGVAETVDLLAMAHHIAGMQGTAVHLYERAVMLFRRSRGSPRIGQRAGRGLGVRAEPSRVCRSGADEHAFV